MKKILYILLLLISVNTIGQPVLQRATSGNTVKDERWMAGLNAFMPRFSDTSAASLAKGIDSSAALVYIYSTSSFWFRQHSPKRWVQISGSDSLLTGGTITSIPTVGYAAPSNANAARWIQSVFYQSQAPTASLSGGGSYELHSAGTFPLTLNWSAGRQSATQPLATIVVAGVSQTFTQPSAGSSVSGTQGVTVTYNSNVTYTNTVTTTDSKSASATTSVSFFPKRYWGISSLSAPDNTIVLASSGGSNELTTTKVKGSFVITVSGTNQYVYYAYPSSYGTLSSIIISGLESIGAFTLTTLSVTNALGYVQDYYVYTSNNQFNNTTISFNSVN